MSHGREWRSEWRPFETEGPTIEEPFSVEWQCHQVAPQSHLWMPSGEIGKQSKPK